MKIAPAAVRVSRARLDELRAKMVELLLAKEAALPDFLKAPVAAVRKDPGLDPFFRHAPHLLIVQGDPKTGVTPQVDCDAACAYFDLLAPPSASPDWRWRNEGKGEKRKPRDELRQRYHVLLAFAPEFGRRGERQAGRQGNVAAIKSTV